MILGNNLQDAVNWTHLQFGQFPVREVIKQTNWGPWQLMRRSMLGESLEFKMRCLEGYLEINHNSHHAKCVVTNYVHALKRGGLIR